jgi:6,7-dimethyl-8-ribityllumazine synthase
MKIGIVVAEFNRDVTSKLEEGALAFLKEKGFKSKDIELIHVPGAFEIPLVAKALLKKKSTDAVIALGAVIRGETTHYDYVCQAVERGCTMLQLEFVKPVVFGVLTTENEEQAFDRVGGKHGHKGRDAAETAIRMIEILKKIKKLK